ncbi:MAG: HD-GYP domain-containing protein [Gammaproteobacteria bacterium]|nr:HD-GYP domain-containing protein [Gammaproteobacteria bacterium]
MIDNSRTCRWCGQRATESSYASERDGVFCCEGCFLGYMAQQRSERERDATQLALVEALAAALDAREQETGMHSKRVACHTQVLARHFSQDDDWLQQVYWGSLLHDIGKIAIPDGVLLKEGPLSEAEWVIMRSHPQRGHDIIAGLPFMARAANIVLSHEERYDGGGYPHSLAGDDITWGARLFAVIDTLDAMTSDRPYRQGLPFDEAKAEILRMSGSQFDPRAVEAFVAEEAVLREMVEMKCAITPQPYQATERHGMEEGDVAYCHMKTHRGRG